MKSPEMKAFLLYTLARLLLFLAVFGLLWLVFGGRLTWNTPTVLWTALIALAVSAFVALFALGSLRERLAGEVAGRAQRAKAAFEARRAAEDYDVPPAAESRDERSAPENPDVPRPAEEDR